MSFQVQDDLCYLCQAIKCGNIKQIPNLIQNSVNVNCNAKSNTPVHWAIIKFKLKHLKTITMLLNSGANIHTRNHDNHTPFDLAIQDEKIEAASLLIERGALVGEDLNQLLLKAINKNNDTIVQMLINHGMLHNLSIDFQTVFNPTITQGNPKIIETIIPRCGSLKPFNLYIPRNLVIQSDEQSKKSVELLLLKWNFTTNPNNYQDEDFIYGAVKNGYLPIVVQLLEYGINVNMVNLKTGLNLLIVACINKHHEIVEQLLQYNADVNVIVSRNNNTLNNISCLKSNIREFSNLFPLNDHRSKWNDVTCLHIAIFNSDFMTANILLKYHIKIKDYTELFNLTCIAAKNGCEGIVRKFLNLGVNVTHINFQRKSLLDFGTNFDSDEKNSGYNVVKLLLEKGADIYLQPLNNHFVFEAIKKKHWLIAKLFLNYNANVQYISPNGYTSLHLAIKYCFAAKFIKTLLKLNSPVNTVDHYGHSPLLDACIFKSQDQLEIIEALLQYNANVNYTDGCLVTPLHFASYYKNLKIVKTLLNKGANPHAMNNEGQTPLHIACTSISDSTASIIQLLLKHGANIEAIDGKGWTPLYVACEMDNTEAVKCLLNNQANPYVIDNDGHSPFHIACQYDDDQWNSEITQLLMQRNGNIESKNIHGRTPLLIACTEKCYPAVECLLKNHANVNATDNEGETPLHIVCKWIDFEIECESSMKLLLEHGANIEAVDKSGRTPLFTACNYKNFQSIEFLLKHYANPNHTDLKNLTPLQIVIQQACVKRHISDEFYEIVQLLIKYGATINVLDGNNQTPLHRAVQEMIIYSKDNGLNATSQFTNCEALLKILVLQGIRLKTAGLEVKNHKSNVIFKPDDYIIIDGRRYSANNILQLNVISSHFNNVITITHTFYGVGYSITDIQQAKSKCEQEIEKMKKESIGIDDFTFYDLLKKNLYFLRRIVDNETIQSILKKETHDTKFPLYIEMVKSRLRVAKIRHKHYILSIFAREHFTLNVYERLPYECIDMILSFLNIIEVKMFIEAMKPLNDS